MSETPELTRRAMLRATGGAVAATTVFGAATTVSAAESEWTVADSPTTSQLADVAYTVDGPYAVGEGGLVLGRTDGEWDVVIENGPAAAENPLNTVDVTDDGERIWFAGGSGALGAYDVLDNIKYDYSAPMEKTSTWEGIAVTGTKDDEYLIASNGSGETLDGQRDDDGQMVWGDVIEPAGGSTIPELSFSGTVDTISGDIPSCYGVDTSQEAFRSDDFNDSWQDIGVRNASEAFYDVTSTEDRVYVAAGGGIVYRYDIARDNWTPVDAGSRSLLAIDRDDADDTILASASEGYVYERLDEGWVEMETPTTSGLYGVAYADQNVDDVVSDPVDVAVGEGGTIVERSAGL